MQTDHDPKSTDLRHARKADEPSGTHRRPMRLEMWNVLHEAKSIPEVVSNDELSKLRPATAADAMRVWEPVILRICMRDVAPHDQPDLVQDIFLAMHKAWTTHVISSECPFAYTLKIAINCRKQLLGGIARQERRRRFLESIRFLQPERAHQETPVEEITSAREQLKLILEQGLGTLPKRQREAFVLVCLDDLPFKAAGIILGVHTNTVRERVKAARAQLVRFLRPRV